MDPGAVVMVFVVLIGFFGPLALMVLRWRRIKRYGREGGEFGQPFAKAGYGGVAPGTVIQEDFGGVQSSQTQSAAEGSEAGGDDRVG